MKTILITSFHPHISRNILHDHFLGLLNPGTGCKVILLVPDSKISYFRNRYADVSVHVEGVPVHTSSATKHGLFFKRIARLMLPTNSALLQNRVKLHKQGGRAYFMGFFALRLLGHIRLFRTLVRFLDFHFSPKYTFEHIFAKHRVDLIFSTDVQNEDDVLLLQTAKRRNIPTVSMVRSWDNLTVHGLIRLIPDTLVVGSELLKKRAISIHDVPSDRIQVIGIPHHDKYIKERIETKDAFFKRIGVPSGKKVILFAPIGDRYLVRNDIDMTVLRILATLDVFVIVRFPPGDNVTLNGLNRPENMYYDFPGSGFVQKGLAEISTKDDEMLLAELAYCDVVVTGPSTVGLEAMIFDKPTIVVDFYPDNRHYLERVTYDFDHLADILSTGGLRRARTKEEFLRAIYCYLENPRLDEEKRRVVRGMQFPFLDGKNSERLFLVIKEVLHRHV